MTAFFTRLYDYLSQHKMMCWSTLVVLLALFGVAIAQLGYKEDITDFIAVDEQYKMNMAAYRESNLTNRTLVLFDWVGEGPANVDSLTQTVDAYFSQLTVLDTTHLLQYQAPHIDFTQFDSLLVNLYENAPYLLRDQDYSIMDSLLAQPNYIQEQLADRKSQLFFSSSPILTQQMMYDPLALFTPIWQRLAQYQPESNFDWSSGYIFTPDGKKVITFVESRLKDTDTQANLALVDLLEAAKAQTPTSSSIDIRFIGSAMIAMANAHQVNHDAILAMCISLVLIIALLLFSFKRWQPMLLILLSTAFGYAFALAILSLFRSEVSLIVLGISSMMVGIAVNYPLHYLFHLKYVPQPKEALRQLAAPLLIGNITTVGAFLTLVPLQAVALQDLGWFCAFMLIGTILFVMIFLPQFKTPTHLSQVLDTPVKWVDTLEKWQMNPYLLGTVGVITLILAYFSFKTEFDPNIAHLNYMTPDQKQDIQYLSKFSHQDNQTDLLYLLVTSAQGTEPELREQTQLAVLEKITPLLDSLQHVYPAMQVRMAADFCPSQTTQIERIQKWNEFVAHHPQLHGKAWEKQVQQAGFTPEAFQLFSSVFQPRDTVPMHAAQQSFLVHQLLKPYFTSQGLMAQLGIPREATPAVKQALQTQLPASVVTFDVASMHQKIANTLSDNFNYIGWACGLLVFIFLWVSFKRIELAIVAFIPMVVGWIWITGIMYLLDIRFNLVNIILASFIFGQGDDYTIFVTEGLLQEYREGKKSLLSYKLSVVLSASIMLVGMGSLIISAHPAMFSLAEVSIIGMLVVVVMSWLLPPVLFRMMLRISPRLGKKIAPNT